MRIWTRGLGLGPYYDHIDSDLDSDDDSDLDPNSLDSTTTLHITLAGRLYMHYHTSRYSTENNDGLCKAKEEYPSH